MTDQLIDEMIDDEMIDEMADQLDETVEAGGLDVIAEALSVIDRALGQMLNRELVSTDEVSDLLLDVRSLLTTDISTPSDN